MGNSREVKYFTEVPKKSATVTEMDPRMQFIESGSHQSQTFHLSLSYVLSISVTWSSKTVHSLGHTLLTYWAL